MIVANSILSARWRLQGAPHSADSRRSERATPRVDRCHSVVSTGGTVFDSTRSARPAPGFILALRRDFFPAKRVGEATDSAAGKRVARARRAPTTNVNHEGGSRSYAQTHSRAAGRQPRRPSNRAVGP